jgi:hypothetical protein
VLVVWEVPGRQRHAKIIRRSRPPTRISRARRMRVAF